MGLLASGLRAHDASMTSAMVEIMMGQGWGGGPRGHGSYDENGPSTAVAFGV